MEAFLLLSGFLAIIVLISHNLLLGIRTKSRTRIRSPPEAAGRWPLMGHLHLLQEKEKPLALILSAMADKYGPAFTVWMGVRRTVVVSSPELVKECFGTSNDKILATRPRGAAGKYMGYNYAMIGLAPHGPAWRDSRKLATVELLSSHRLESLKHLRSTEVAVSISHLYGLWERNGKSPVEVEMKEWFHDLTFNAVVMMIAGKRYFGSNVVTGDLEEARRARRAISEFVTYIGAFVAPSDVFPFLEWLDLKGHIGAMKRVFGELDSIASLWIDEHRRRRRTDAHHQHLNRDFIDVMLSFVGRTEYNDSESYIKAVSLALIIGGTDTSFITLTWSLSLLLNHQNKLKKVQEELDTVVGKLRTVNESDVENLPYLRAVVKECLRLYPPAPLGGPHEAMEDCSIGGFHVPAGTRVLANLYRLHRDPRVWADPEEFRPERFLPGRRHGDTDVRGTHFEFIPFGSGRRMCPGITSALQILHLALARLLHGFRVETPNGEGVSMRAGTGAAMPKVDPLHVIVSPRLPVNLYD